MKVPICMDQEPFKLGLTIVHVSAQATKAARSVQTNKTGPEALKLHDYDGGEQAHKSYKHMLVQGRLVHQMHKPTRLQEVYKPTRLGQKT